MSGSIVGLKLLKSDKMDQSDKYIWSQLDLTSSVSSPGTEWGPKFGALWDIQSYIYKVCSHLGSETWDVPQLIRVVVQDEWRQLREFRWRQADLQTPDQGQPSSDPGEDRLG